MKTLGNDLALIRGKSPLVHNITNFVVMNSTANALLALGASPVMAHAKEEVEEMTGIASSLVINLGTLSPDWVDAMVLAGQKAFSKGIPIVLDPVGVGATRYRADAASRIIEKCHPSVIRGNASEIRCLAKEAGSTKGVDSTIGADEAIEAAKRLANDTGAVVVISGATDYITNGKEVRAVSNGSPIMAKVTGMGCTASAIIGAFAAVNPNLLDAATNAMALMGVVGEYAALTSAGPGSFQVVFTDGLYKITPHDLTETAKISIM